MSIQSSVSQLSVQSKPNAKRYTPEVIEARQELREAIAMEQEARLSWNWARNMGDDYEGYWQDLEYTSGLVRERQARLKSLMEA